MFNQKMLIQSYEAIMSLVIVIEAQKYSKLLVD